MKYLLEKDIKLIINYKRILLSIILCMMVYIGFSYIFQDFMKETRLLDQVNVGIVDNEQSFLTGMLIDNFKQNEAFSGLFKVTVDNEHALIEKYNKNELSAIIYLPESFTDSLYRFENIPLRMTLNPNFPLKNTVLENIMGSYSTYIQSVDVGIFSLYSSLKNEGIPSDELTEINEAFSMKMVLNALNRSVIFEHRPVQTYPSALSIHYFAYSMMILTIVFTASSGSNLYNDELTQSSLSRYITTGQSIFPFALSKVIVMSMNILIILLPFMVIIGFMMPDMHIVSLLLMVLLYTMVVFLFVSISLFLGLIFYKHRVNALFSTMITLFLGIVGGQFFPIQIMPKFLQDIASLTPNYWILKSSLHLNSNLIGKDYLITLIITGIGILLFNVLQIKIIHRRSLWEK